jgi:preprotein translocase subunit SecA
VEEIQFWNHVGRPILVGTLSIDQSHKISDLLDQTGIEHSILNAMNSAEEAQIVKSSGRFGAVTVATNMAGRGTDILLQPGLDHAIIDQYLSLVDHHIGHRSPVILDCRSENEASMMERAITKHLDSTFMIRSGCNLEILPTERNKPPVHIRFGLGLHVIGTEVNQSLRTDDQLRGRSGRQGEFGSSEFVLSLEDKALSGFTNIWALNECKTRPNSEGGNYYEHPNISHNLNRFQSIQEQEHISQQNRILDYSKVTDHLTARYYRTRNRFVGTDNLSDHVIESIRRISKRIVTNHMPVSKISEYKFNFYSMIEEVKLDYGIDCSELFGLGIDTVTQELERLLVNTYNTHRSAFGLNINDVERRFLLETTDHFWSSYLGESQDKILSSQVYSLGHHTAINNFMIDRSNAFDKLIQDATDSFFTAFLKLDPQEPDPQPELEPEIIADIESVLISKDDDLGIHELDHYLPSHTQTNPDRSPIKAPR